MCPESLYSTLRHDFILLDGQLTADPVVERYCHDNRRDGEPGPFLPPDGIVARNSQPRYGCTESVTVAEWLGLKLVSPEYSAKIL